MGSGSQFKNVFEGDEVERFLGDFVLGGKERDEKIAKAPNEGWQFFPADLGKALADMKEVWEANGGFLTPAETRAKLMEKYLPNSHAAIRDFIRESELSRDEPEATTGYLGKEHAYTTTGLAHLYAMETGKPVAMVEVDFSNMGGTNDYFKAKIAQERGIKESEVPPAAYMGMTDMAMRVLCNAMTETLKEQLPEGTKIIPIRTGGDELRIIVSGDFDMGEMKTAANGMHASIERHVAAMGLQDHAHLKDPKNPVRNGFGAALVVQDMGAIENVHTVIQDLDARIKTVKEQLGLTRLGQIDRTATVEKIRHQIETGVLEVPEGISQGQFVRDEVSRREVKVQQASKALHNINPSHNNDLDGSMKAYEQYVEDNKGEAYQAKPLAGYSLDAIKRIEAEEPMQTVHERRMGVTEKVWGEWGIYLNGPEKKMVELSVSGLTAVDPSAQAYMPQVLAPTAEVFAKDREMFKATFTPDQPAVQKALQAAGMNERDLGTPIGMAVSFHNLGGLNGLLGHHNSDIVLREMTKIIENSLEKAGVPTAEPKPYVIAHTGGACYTVLLKPGVVGPDGNPQFISEQHVAKAEDNIRRGVEVLNNMNVADFLSSRGADTGPAFMKMLADENVTTFSDVKDPKKRSTDVDGQKIEGRVPGLGVGLMHIPFPDDPGLNGQEFANKLKHLCDHRVEDLRRKVLVQSHVAKVMAEVVQGVVAGAHPGMEDHCDRHALCVFHRLPDLIQPGMSPEVQSLIQFKGSAMEARAGLLKIKDGGGEERERLVSKYDAAITQFKAQFDDLAQGGGLMQVAQYFTNSAKETPGIAATVAVNAVQTAPATKFNNRKPGNGVG